MIEKASSLKAPVFDWEKKKIGEVTLSSEIFSKAFNESLVHSVVLWQLAKHRKGTHKAKTKGEVRGGGAKPYRQKGTGNARRGSSRSPLIAGGGVIFPPRPRDYSYSLPKTFKKAAMKSVLSYLWKENQLFVLQDIKVEKGKTKELLGKLSQFGLDKALLISDKRDPLVERAARNLAEFKYNSLEGLNVYDLLKYRNLILDQKALKRFQDTYFQSPSLKRKNKFNSIEKEAVKTERKA